MELSEPIALMMDSAKNKPEWLFKIYAFIALLII